MAALGVVGGLEWAKAQNRAPKIWPDYVCNEIGAYSKELGDMKQPADVKVVAQAPLMKLWQERCN
ncbi:hypothetical protein CWO91_16475 [Bradyrhizobium genosp. SA-3]|nr:hypothetical protein CWO91_16475 [Bradyrhizobium genosp. SA-3]